MTSLALHRNRRTLSVLSALLMAPALFILSGCASIMHGTTQEISISSSPTGAQVRVNNQELGTTPVVADLKRKDNHTIRVSMEGYEPFEMGLTRSVSGSSHLYKLSPEQVQATLARGGAEVRAEGDVLVLQVLMQPVEGAERIGTLVPVGR